MFQGRERGQRSRGCSAKGPPEGAVSGRPCGGPEPLQPPRLLRRFHLKINFIPTHKTDLCLAKIKSTVKENKQPTRSLPPPQKRAPNQPQKDNQNLTVEKLVTLVLYCVQCMVVGFGLVLWGDREGYQPLSIFCAYDNTGPLIHEICQD